MARAVSKIFKTPLSSASADTVNREGYLAFSQPIEEAYLQMLLTNTFGDAYYATQKELVAEAEKTHTAMLAKDPSFVAKALPYARNRGFMRTQPIYGLVRMSADPASAPYFEETFNEVIKTPNDLGDFFTILNAQRKGEGGRRVKRVAGKWLMKNLSPYWTVKYGATKQGGYSLRDLFCTLHPKGPKSVLVDYLFGRAADGLPETVQAFERLKKATTDSEKASAIEAGRLPHEVASSFAGKSAEVWTAIVKHMPVFAMLRNLATMERHGVMPAVRDHVVATLSNKEVIAKSKILPFRFVEAMKHVNDAKVQDALRDALDHSFAGVPDITGRTATFLDISGSMEQMLQSAAVFAISAMKKANGNGRLLQFDTKSDEVKVSMRDSTLTQAAAIRIRGGTDCSAPMQQILREKDKFDNVLMITDEQQNFGTAFCNVLDEYRAKINKNAKCFILNVAPYHGALSGQLAPHDPKGQTFWVYGWSDQALQYIAFASQGWGTFVDAVKAGGKYVPEGEKDE